VVDQVHGLKRHEAGGVVVRGRLVEPGVGFVRVPGANVRVSHECLGAVGEQGQIGRLCDVHGPEQRRQRAVGLALHELRDSQPDAAVKESERRVV